METTPLQSGYSCPEHGVLPDYRVVPGSILPHCAFCGRIVTQVEIDLPEGEAF